MASVLATAYSICSYLPISVFIGGEGFITANVTILPLIAYLLDFEYALTASVIGGAVMYFTGTSITPIFGPLAVTIPALGAIFGNLTKKSRFAALPLVAAGAVIYLLFSGGTALWLALYIAPVITSILSLKHTNLELVNCCVSTAISELIAMDILTIFILNFPGYLWIIILPFAAYERTVAVLASTLILRGVMKYTKMGSVLQSSKRYKM